MEKDIPIVTWKTSHNVGIMSISNGSQNKIAHADFLNLSDFKRWITGQDLKGLLITGKGRHFSAGADTDHLKSLINNSQYLTDSLRKGREILNYIQNLPMVTVAAINGICFGAGLEIALACKFRFCGENSVLAFPEANLGIMPGLSGTIRLPKLIGYNKALEIILSGRSINAEEAKDLGLVDKIYPKNELVASAQQFIIDLVGDRTHQQLTNINIALNNTMMMDEESAQEKETALFVSLLNRLSEKNNIS